MSSRWLRLSLGIVSSLSFVLAACDRPSDITSPESNSVAVPQYSEGPNSQPSVIRDLSLATVNVTAHESEVCEIDAHGGVCSVPGAMIVVPENAVAKRTFFQIKLDVGPNVVVSLNASSKRCKKQCDDDVGEAGFKVPVILTVAKFGATASAGRNLVLGFHNGSVNKVVATTDLGWALTAAISHFTDYVILQ